VKTLRQFASGQVAIPLATAWYLSDLGEFRGKQELYTHQSPQRLRALREHSLIESAVSSNRIEGVSVDPARVRAILVSPKPLFRDRDEEEVRGYRDALAWIHAESAGIALDERGICRLHALTRGEIWDAGRYKEKDGDIIERYPDGRQRVRFHPVPACATSAHMADLVQDWHRCLDEGWVPPLIALAAFNLDLLCIHPKFPCSNLLFLGRLLGTGRC
jgi:Fic family protein